MVDEHRMPNGRLRRREGTFLENGGVQRSPSGVLAVGDQAVSRAYRPAVRLVDAKNRKGFRHGKHAALLSRFLFTRVNFLLACGIVNSLVFTARTVIVTDAKREPDRAKPQER